MLTIFNFQTFDNPFLAGNATFIVTPNPFAHTTNATDYLDLTTWFNFIVSDGDQFDSDPTPGIIEVKGVNNGTYSVMQIKGSPGFGMASYPEASDEILGTTGFSYITQTFVNFTTTTSTTVEPPLISDTLYDKLKNTGGAKINGVAISSKNDLPPAKIVTSSQKLTATPPDHVVFTQTFSTSATPSTLINTLGIPTYSPPTDTSSGTSTSFIPPVYVAPVSSNGGNFILTPVMDTIVAGSNIVIRADKVSQGGDHPMLESIELPMNTQGSNVGISVKVDDAIPSGSPSVPSGFAKIYLDFQTTGDIDFSDSGVYSEDPTIRFTLEKVGSDCPTGVTLYLQQGSSWSTVGSNLSATSTGTHTCTYSKTVDHFSSYLVGTGNTDAGHNHGDSSHSSSHADSHTGHTHTGHTHTGHTHSTTDHEMDPMPGDHPYEHAIMEITKTLMIYEIQYSLETGSAQIIIGTTGSVGDIEVQAHTRTGGLVTAKPAKINPFELFNKQSISDLNKYVFEIPLNPSETYFRISVDDSQYTLAQTVAIDGIRGKIIPWYAEVSQVSDHSGHLTSESTTNPAEYAVKFDGGIKTVSYNDVQFPIKYEMAGSISGITVDESSKSVTFLLGEVAGGMATIQVPRSLVDSTGNNFVVFVTASPQEQIEYDLISSTSDHYTLQMNLPEGASSFTIVGTAVVPEFGLLAPLILSLAIIPIILARKRLAQL
ncbi:MAG: PEFG-CTERM sorting domain-containing protein [Nitrososphaerota archaeon]|nr:PEFG-CTERM sorting domain-containing protein [Nitrososphaerota archaeon]